MRRTLLAPTFFPQKKKDSFKKLTFFFAVLLFLLFYFSVMKALLVTLKRDTLNIINLTFEIFP